jgi:hypothetical protein
VNHPFILPQFSRLKTGNNAIKNALEDARDNVRNVYVIAKPLPDDELNQED